MSIAKTLNGIVLAYPYTWYMFESDTNNTNYGVERSEPNIQALFPQSDYAKQSGASVVSPSSIAPPDYVAAIQHAPMEAQPIFIDGVLTQQWNAPVSFIPQQVSGIQLRMAVMASPLASTIASFVTAQSPAIQMAYNTTEVFNRPDVLLAAIIHADVLTSDQVDGLFIAAAQVEV